MSDTVTCIIHVPGATPLTAVQPVFVNGSHFPIQINTPIELPRAAFDALVASSLNVEELPAGEVSLPAENSGGEGEGGASEPGGLDGAAAPPREGFDPEAVIVGTIADVEGRLADLNPTELELVLAAENDREVSRKGVQELIAKAQAAKAEATNQE